MATRKTKISDLLPDQRNANVHSEKGMRLLEKSIQDNGLGRSILLSADDEIIAGNGVVETAAALGIENVRIIETNGKEIIAVKRMDVKSGTKEFYNMALADNVVAKNNIVLDAEVCEAIVEDYKETEFWAQQYITARPGEDELTDKKKNNPPTFKVVFETIGDLKAFEELYKQQYQEQFTGSYYSVSFGEL